MADFFEMMMSGSGLDGYKPRSALDLLISDKLTPDQNKSVQSRGRLGLAKGLLAMSGPSTTPVSFGQAFASGIDQMQQARAGAVDEMLKGAQISNLTDDGEVDEDIEVYMRTDDPKTDYDDTKRKVIIKRSEYNKDMHVLDEPGAEDNETMEVYLTENNKDTPYDDTKTKTLIKKSDYDSTKHRLELDEVEYATMKVYPKVDDPTTEVDETQQSIAIKPSAYDENKYSLDPGYQNEYIKAKKIAEEIHPGDPASQAEYIKSQVGALTKNDTLLFNQKIKINEQQIFINDLNNQFAKEINELEIDNKKLHNAGLELSNQHQEVVNSNQGYIAELDIESKQLANLKSQVELETLPDIKEAELVNLKTNIEATRQKIAFDDKANIKKLDKMDLEIDGLLLKNQATKLDIDNAPIVNKLINEGKQLDNLLKEIDLEFAPEKAKKELDNLELRNNELLQTIEFNDENNLLIIQKNKDAIAEAKWKIENPDVDWDQIKVEGTFRKEYNSLPQVKNAIVSETFYNDLSVIIAEQNREDGKFAEGPQDLAIMFNYMKMLDPDSVVREGEQVLLKDTKGIPEKVLTMFKKAQSGEFLDVNQRKQILAVTTKLMSQRVMTYQNTYNKYSKIAKNNGFDVERAVPKLDFPRFSKITEATGVLNNNPYL